MCSRKTVLSLKTKVVAACGSINPWLKPYDRRMYFFVMCRSGWLGLVFMCMQMKFGLKGHSAKPAGLGEAGRPKISPNLAEFWIVSS
jgi:hypothetical protein